MTKRLIAAFLVIACLVAACDSGDVYPEQNTEAGRQVDASFCFRHLGAFPESEYYQLVLASFGEDAVYPLSFKTIVRPVDENTVVPVSLANIPDQASYVSLSLLDKGKKLICHFYRYSVEGLGKETVEIPCLDIDLATYDRVQAQVFTIKCVACHGGANFTAAGLDLTGTHSYGSLVGHSSSVHPDMFLVDPDDPRKSFLLEVLTDRDALSTDHTEIVKDDDIRLLETWMENGCPQ